MRASQAENVVLVGENSMGCLTFGNPGIFQLPHSRLKVRLPINFGLFRDLTFREEVGLTPDLWVPAADAVNYAVAAVRAGTITTYRPLSPEQLEAPFQPEDPWAGRDRERILLLAFYALCAAGGGAFAYFNRHKPRMVAAAGAFNMVISSAFLLKGEEIGFGFTLAGGICLVSAGIMLARKRRG
jgi:hypothetical protein